MFSYYSIPDPADILGCVRSATALPPDGSGSRNKGIYLLIRVVIRVLKQ